MTQLTTTENKALSLPDSTKNLLQSMGIDISEAKKGHLVLAQDNSKGLRTAVPNAKPGDICDLLNNTVIGGPQKEVVFIPFKHVKYWAMIDVNTNRKIKTIPMTKDNASWKMGEVYEIDINQDGRSMGVKAKPSLVHNWYVLLADQAKEGFATLYNLPIKGMSYSAHGSLTHFIVHSAGLKMMSFEKMYALQSVPAKNNKGEFFIYQVKQHSKTPADYMEMCLYWWEILNQKVITPEEVEVPEE